MARPSDYLITPGDLAAWARSLGPHDMWGLALAGAAGLAVGWWLGDPGAGLFAAGLMVALWWRVDSRWPLGAALCLLVFIPVLQLAYDHNWLYSGDNFAGGAAVAVWYLLAIGVVRQVLELRGVTAPQPTTVAPSAAAVAPSAAPATARHPLPVPTWRRRLAAIERESAMAPGHRTALDGLGKPKPARPAARKRRK